MKSMCFSGHRFSKIKSLVSKNHVDKKFEKDFFEIIKLIIYIRLTNYIDSGFKRFYIGMADGIDLWVGEELVELKTTQYPEIQIIPVKPFAQHGSDFSIENKKIYDDILNVADEIVCLQSNWTKSAYFQRNRYMVDNSTNLLAFIYDYESGTGYTIKYAQSLGKSIDIVDLSNLINIFNQTITQHKTFYDMTHYF